MKSKMGEYLRRIMFERLLNPHFHPGYILKTGQKKPNNRNARF